MQIDPEKYDDPELKSLGLYEVSFVMKGDDWKAGEKYILKAIHGSSDAYDEFSIDARKPVVQSDKSVYVWGSEMILTVIDPDADKDSDEVEFVGDRSDSKLIIESSKGKLENYRLQETGDSTAIFQGLIGFIGVKDDGKVEPYTDGKKSITKTQGKEFDDGFLEVAEQEELVISYSNATGTAHLTVFVIKSFESVLKK